MTLAFLAIAFVTVAAAAVAMALRNLIHSALLLVFNWAGIAAFYLWAGAEFVAFSQLMVYVGAVSMVVLFAVLLTQRSPQSFREQPDSISRVIGALLVGGAVLGKSQRASVTCLSAGCSGSGIGNKLPVACVNES